MISASDVSFFKENGFVVVRDLLDRNIVAECLQAVRDFSSEPNTSRGEVVFDSPDVGSKAIKYIKDVDYNIPVFKKLLHSRIIMAAAALLEQDTYFHIMEVHNKVPHGGTRSPAHQDNFYFCFEPPDALTAYVPLEQHNSDNGGLCFVPKSHLDGTIAHTKSKVPAFSSGLDNESFDDDLLYKIDAKPGDVSFHHCNTIHLAPPNVSDVHRHAVSIRINGVRARISPEMKARYEEYRAYNRAEQS
jgi:phytanoyl-CoA hydroxylase